MEINQNPFSLYDFLGYLIPGIFCLLGGIYIYSPDLLWKNIIINDSYNLVMYIVTVIICYCLGHILSYLSSITVEKYSIWTLGYPSRYLLNHEIPGFWRNFWRGNNKQILLGKLKSEKYYIVIKKEDKSVLDGLKRKIQCFGRFVMCMSILPVVLTDLLVRKVFSYREFLGKPLDPVLADKIKLKIELFNCEQYGENFLKPGERTTDQDGEPRDPDFFRLIYHYANEHTKNHYGKMQNYVALYGFTRTMCFTMIALLWGRIGFAVVNHAFSVSIILPICIYVCVIAIFYLDFNKFFRRYTLEALMAFTAIYCVPKPKNEYIGKNKGNSGHTAG